jgi:hypothetical protein
MSVTSKPIRVCGHRQHCVSSQWSSLIDKSNGLRPGREGTILYSILIALPTSQRVGFNVRVKNLQHTQITCENLSHVTSRCHV